MTKQVKKNVFDAAFLWGAASAAHQVEGGLDNQWTQWESTHAASSLRHSQKHYQDLSTWSLVGRDALSEKSYISGDAVGHYGHYEQDFDYLMDMNMNAYRFSIEWSRLQPKEGEWNDAAIQHYRDMLLALRKRQIEPIVTLFHFTLPTWFADMGGFEKKSNIAYFIKFVDKVMAEYGDLIRTIITINEPTVYASISYLAGMWPPGRKNPLLAWRVLGNLTGAHNQAAAAIHARGKDYQVSIAHNAAHFTPEDSSLLTKMTIRLATYYMDDRWLRKVIGSCDFLGVNYYMTHRIKGMRLMPPREPVTDLNWSIEPADIEHVLRRLYGVYRKPIMITENGLADTADTHRQYWIDQTLGAIERAIVTGVPVTGYLHWSLMDNFEWSFGRWPRFGLVAFDYETGEKTLRGSASWFADVIKRKRAT